MEIVAVCKRTVEQLANVDERIAQDIAKGLRLKGPLAAMPTTVKIHTDLAASPMLSIMKEMNRVSPRRPYHLLKADSKPSTENPLRRGFLWTLLLQ